MKRSLFVLLPFLLVSLGCASAQAQKQQTNLTNYSLHILVVTDTQPAQAVWQVDGVNPNGVYGSLHAPSLLQWVNTLPKGTQITYRSPWLGIPVIGRDRLDPDIGAGKDLDAFSVYCKAKGITFMHLTAANAPVL